MGKMTQFAGTRMLLRCRNLALPLALAAALLFTASGCGAPPDATGTWEGEMTITQGGESLPTDLSLQLEQSEDGLVTGSGTVVVNAPGDTESLNFESVRGRVEEDGVMRLEAKEESLLAERGLELEGEVQGDTMEGEATFATAEILDEPTRFTGEYELEKQDE